MRTGTFYTGLLFGLLLTAAAYSCDIHEFPETVGAEKVSFTLHLGCLTDMPLHQVVDYSTRSSDPSDLYDIRYTVNAYCCDENMDYDREADYSFTVTKDDVTQLDHTVELELAPGVYHFIVWVDYVDDSCADDKYYDTSNFEEICLQGEHCGCTFSREAFYGTVDAEVSAGSRKASVTMERPMGRYHFISNDLGEFITRVLQMRAQKAASEGIETEADGTRAVDLNDFKVVFRYAGFMPSAFNPFTNKPADAAMGVKFESTLSQVNDTDVELGFDYVFVNGSEAKVAVAVEIYDKDGTVVSSAEPVDVPLMRNKYTTVRGNFLTSDASGSVGIDPGFDGGGNYEVK